MATGLQFMLSVGDIDNLSVLKFTGEEALSSAYQYDIHLASRDARISAEQVVDQEVLLSIYQDGIVQQRIHGIACSFERGDTGHHHTHYHLRLVPSLHRLSLRHNSRIFQQQSVPEIISGLLVEMGIDDFAFSLSGTSEKREYCVQYRETDLDFIQRLAAEEGIFYHFTHSVDKHTLIFSNDSQVLSTLKVPLLYNALSSGVSKRPFVRTFSQKIQMQPSSASLKDHSFKKPAYSFLHQQQGVEMAYQRPSYEHYDHPGRYKDDIKGKAFTRIRIEQLRRDSNVATGESNVPQLLSGIKFELQDHPDNAINRDWLLVSVRHFGTQPQALEESAGEGITTYNNSFVALPGHRQWRPVSEHKPRVDGPQIAQVVGPVGEEIFCDKFGRVKIHFPWDRYSGTDEKASCWVRVSQGWAGAQYGMMSIPRVGHEVIVSFLEGDPDQPIITGRTYNAVNQGPYSLPEHKTRTVMRTQTHQGEGYNELRFEDKKDLEEIYIHAQKDINVHVGNDSKATIINDLHMDVKNDRYSQIKNNDNLTVQGQSRHYSKGDLTFITDASMQMKQAKNMLVDAGNEVHIKAGQKIIIDVGSEITLKSAGNYIKIDPSGVHIVGTSVSINAGGSAGTGSICAGQMPMLPGAVEMGVALSPLPLQLSKSLMQQLSSCNVPLIKLCQKQNDGSCTRSDCPCITEDV